MPNADERTITLSVNEWNIVLSGLGLIGQIISKIQSQASAQTPRPNGLDMVAEHQDQPDA